MLKRLEWNRKTASAFAVAAALTIVLLVTLAPKEIEIAENITLKPVTWSFQRPSQWTIIDDRLESSYSTGGLSATFHVWISDFLPRVGSLNYDTLRIILEINAMTTNPDSFIESAQVTAQKDNKSKVGWQETDIYLKNLSLVASVDGHWWMKEAYIKLADVNHTSNIYAQTTILWKLLIPTTQSHQLEITFELIYYNGTAYNKVVQPFQLNIIGRG